MNALTSALNLFRRADPAANDQSAPVEKALTALTEPVFPTGTVREPYAGAWQEGVKVDQDTALAFAAVFSCVGRVSGDLGKMRLKLVELDEAAGVWVERESPAFSPVLRKPNHFQTRIQFLEGWMVSKLTHGNAYMLKRRDARGVVTGLYVLDPRRVLPLIAPDGSIFYRLSIDNLSGLAQDVTVPAREIIHDRWNCLFHPLVGVSPIHACGLSAMHGTAIQQNSTNFFANGAKPSGLLTAPGSISDATAKRLKEYWDANYSGDNSGRTAVLGDGLHYEAITMSAADAQLIEQLQWSAENVCTAFSVPAFKIGAGPLPASGSADAMNLIYFTDALQIHVEAVETLLEDGLELPEGLSVRMETDTLLRMDYDAMSRQNSESIGGGWMTPNEARKRAGLKPIPGGDTAYMQQQHFSLAALHKRDQDDPFSKPSEPASTVPTKARTTLTRDQVDKAVPIIAPAWYDLLSGDAPSAEEIQKCAAQIAARLREETDLTPDQVEMVLEGVSAAVEEYLASGVATMPATVQAVGQ
ncbi:phage portal protein [Pseudomonas benzopyrenica]|uniref:phage portal protein n=1 Tax=Pseudomonas benzopyrenica TaxID=2993566 RepID=UPI003F182342